MEFNYPASTNHSVSYVPHQPLSGWVYNGSYDVEGPNSAIEMSVSMRREMEKAKMREEIMMEIENERIRDEIIVTRRLLEAEVRRELSIEKALALHRGGDLFMDARGFHAPLSPLEVTERPIGERFVTSHVGRFGPVGERVGNCLEGWLGEGEGRLIGERFASSLEGKLGECERRPVGERFATSFDGRLGEWEGGPVGERVATSFEGRLGKWERRPVGERFATSLEGRLSEWERRPVGGRFATSFDGRLVEGEGTPVGELCATSLEGRHGGWEGRPMRESFLISPEGSLIDGQGRPVGEGFATSLDGRGGMSSVLSPDFGSLGTGSHSSVAPHISEAKLHLGNVPHTEKLSLPAKSPQDVNVYVVPSAGSATKQFRQEWSCTLCQVSASSERSLNEHLKGKRHKENEVGLRKKSNNFKIGGFTEKTPTVSTKDASSMSSKVSKKSYQTNAKSVESGSQSQDSNNTKRKDCSFDDSANNSEGIMVMDRKNYLCKQKDKCNRGSPIVRTQEHKKHSLKFWCGMCQIGTDTEKVMMIHRTGKKHLANQKSSLRFWCDVCQIGTDTKQVMEKHLNGNKHLSGLQQNIQKPGEVAPEFSMQPIQYAEANSLDTRNGHNLLTNRSQFSGPSMKKIEAPGSRLRRSRRLKKDSSKFWCKICQVGADSLEVIAAHYYGKKHLANVKKSSLCSGGGKGELPPQ